MCLSKISVALSGLFSTKPVAFWVMVENTLRLCSFMLILTPEFGVH